MLSTPSAALRAVLVEAGYEILIRPGPWVECMVLRPGERWVGTGRDEDDALQNVVDQLIPSHFGRALLDVWVSSPAATARSFASRPVGSGSHPDFRAIATGRTLFERAMRASRNLPVASSAQGVPPSSTAPRSDDGVTTPMSVADPRVKGTTRTVEVVRVPNLKGTAPTSESIPASSLPREPLMAPPSPLTTAVAKSAPTAAEIEEATDTIAQLLRQVETRAPGLARMAPDRQRLNLLVWICRARAIEEQMPDVGEVEHAVASVARRLSELAKMFWPGSVRALQLAASPADVRYEVRVKWATAPVTWREATVLAEWVLQEHVQKANDSGMDEEGWADIAERLPRPPQPDIMLDDVDAKIRRTLAAPDDMGDGQVETLSTAEVDGLVEAAYKLRWLRGSVNDDMAWGIAMGRLRRAKNRLGEQNARIRDVIDPRTKPLGSWAALLGLAPRVSPDAPESGSSS